MLIDGGTLPACSAAAVQCPSGLAVSCQLRTQHPQQVAGQVWKAGCIGTWLLRSTCHWASCCSWGCTLFFHGLLCDPAHRWWASIMQLAAQDAACPRYAQDVTNRQKRQYFVACVAYQRPRSYRKGRQAGTWDPKGPLDDRRCGKSKRSSMFKDTLTAGCCCWRRSWSPLTRQGCSWLNSGCIE